MVALLIPLAVVAFSAWTFVCFAVVRVTFIALMEADTWWASALWVALAFPFFAAWVAPVLIALIMGAP